MKANYKKLIWLIPILILIESVRPATSFSQFIYFLIEGLMTSITICGIVWLVWNRKLKSVSAKWIGIAILISAVLTQITRIIWLCIRGGHGVKFEYFIRPDLMEPTIQHFAGSISAALVVVFLIWLFRLPKKQMIRIGGGVAGLVLVVALTFNWYVNRDLSSDEIYFQYEISDLDGVRDLAREKGKTLYVDFWHSGCKPCIEQFMVHEDFSSQVDKENVHFLFVGADMAMPGEKQRQRLIVEKYNLRGTHTFVSRDGFSEILEEAGYRDSEYGAKAFPHYMIIDEKGEVKEIKAKRPSNEMAQMLNEMEAE